MLTYDERQKLEAIRNHLTQFSNEYTVGMIIVEETVEHIRDEAFKLYNESLDLLIDIEIRKSKGEENAV